MLSNVYGLNYDATVRDAMGINNMPADIKVLESDYFNFVETGEDEKADKTLKMIQKLTGENSDVVQSILARVRLFK